ncbi:MAG: HDIG domain-containing protein [Armatimonadetes bacterium]|nr:HDIG domain-containing protein [Armatimonadota bacterium]
MIDHVPDSIRRNKLGDLPWLAGALSRFSARLVGALLMGGALVLHRTWPVDPRVFAGVAAMSLAAGLFVQFHLKHTERLGTAPRNAERAIWATALLAVAGVQVGHIVLDHQALTKAGFLMIAPVVAQAMLVSGLLGPSIGLVAMTVTSLLLAFGGVLGPDMTAAAWVAAAVGAHVVNPMKQRADLLRAVGIQVVAQAVLAICITAVVSDSVLPVLESALWAGIAAVVAVSIFWLGIALLERAFGIVSDWTLLELCSPEHPLLKELCLRAPGTHVHSLGVANLAEGAARAIGANPVLCRTMACYHDIGKSLRPTYFAENQVGENPHDELSPTLSAQIIASHVKDGVELARAHRLPQTVIDGIQQHHGTSLIAYFYSRAVQSGVADDEGRMEGFFRYEGPKPQHKEAAIIHLADQVEAVGRTVKRGQDLDEVIHKVIESSRADGQLDECDLTFKDLRAIEASFIASLSALRHERVAYPNSEGALEDAQDHHPQRVGHAYKA